MTDRLIYDDDCTFCTELAEAHAERAEAKIVGFGELSEDERERLPEDFEECVHLIRGERVYSCGRAVEEVVTAGGWGAITAAVRVARHAPGWGRVRDGGYRAVADNRSTIGRLVGDRCSR